MSDDRNAVSIRPATHEDIPFMMAMDRSCETGVRWTEHHYQEIFQRGMQGLVLVAERSSSNATADADGILGFLVARHVAPEWELENIVVDLGARRRGLGMWLLEGLLAEAQRRNSDAIFLEVRESNTAARGMYEKAGFRRTGRRKFYYADPSEDAILYRFELA